MERRAPGVEHDTARVTFYRDGRFGALVRDGAATLWGAWRLDDVEMLGDAASSGLGGRLALHFDHAAERSGVFRVAFRAPPRGPMVLTAESGVHPARLELTRALPLEAALVGAWYPPAGTPYRGEHAVEALGLGRDGHFVARLGGGVVRAGRWAFERLDGASLNTLVGALVLDPSERAFPVERWTAMRLQGTPPTLVLHPPASDGRATRLELHTLDPFARPLVATWRRYTSAATTRVPQEFTLHADGSLDALLRAGTPRTSGRWVLAQIRRGPDRLVAAIAVTLRPFGHAPEQDRWHVVLPFARGADLEVLSERDGGTARCRRLFR